MNGPQHYAEAERLREAARNHHDDLEWAAYFNAAAQVHATLALAAATAGPTLGLPGVPSSEWQEATA